MAPNDSIYSTRTLLGVMYDDEVTMPPSNYWLGFFPTQINFDTEYVDFNQITENRKLAPLVVPTTQGKPVYSAAEKRVQVKPAYVKPKDAVSASRVIKKVAGQGELHASTNNSPQTRYLILVGDIMSQHRRTIERRWEWLASEAIQHGKVTLVGDAYPETVIDFERDAGHTLTLGGGSQWGDAGVSILGNIESWRKTMRRAKFGGPANRITVGVEAWDAMRQDSEIRELLNFDYRPQNNGLDLNLGVMEGLDVEYVGKLSGTLEVYVYSDYYQLEDGTITEFMDPRDVVLTGPGIGGTRCFGAIQDIDANLQSLPMFPKMDKVFDPSATVIMTQSAPLMVPMRPNSTFRARVVA